MFKSFLTLTITISLIRATHSTEACPADKHCSSCSGSKCVICHTDYYPDSSGICQKVNTVIDKCGIYAADGLCSFCDLGYNVSGGNKCVKIPVDGCEFANNGNDCWVCSDGLIPENNNCENKDVKCQVKNCKTCLFTAVICFECEEGYGNFNGACVKFDNCSTVLTTDQNKCERCIEPAYNSDGKCLGSASIANWMTVITSALLIAFK